MKLVFWALLFAFSTTYFVIATERKPIQINIDTTQDPTFTTIITYAKKSTGHFNKNKHAGVMELEGSYELIRFSKISINLDQLKDNCWYLIKYSSIRDSAGLENNKLIELSAENPICMNDHNDRVRDGI